MAETLEVVCEAIKAAVAPVPEQRVLAAVLSRVGAARSLPPPEQLVCSLDAAQVAADWTLSHWGAVEPTWGDWATVRDGILSLRRRFATERQIGLLEASGETTAAYASLVAACGLAAIGDVGRARELGRSSAAELADREDHYAYDGPSFHLVMATVFSMRLAAIMGGAAICAPTDREILDEMAGLPRMARYKADKLREFGSLLRIADFESGYDRFTNVESRERVGDGAAPFEITRELANMRQQPESVRWERVRRIAWVAAYQPQPEASRLLRILQPHIVDGIGEVLHDDDPALLAIATYLRGLRQTGEMALHAQLLGTVDAARAASAARTRPELEGQRARNRMSGRLLLARERDLDETPTELLADAHDLLHRSRAAVPALDHDSVPLIRAIALVGSTLPIRAAATELAALVQACLVVTDQFTINSYVCASALAAFEAVVLGYVSSWTREVRWF